MSDDVLAIVYVGKDGERYVHIFGDGRAKFRTVAGAQCLDLDALPNRTDVLMMADGDDVVVIHHLGGKPLSREF